MFRRFGGQVHLGMGFEGLVNWRHVMNTRLKPEADSERLLAAQPLAFMLWPAEDSAQGLFHVTINRNARHVPT